LELLDKNSDILGPFLNFWPNYNASCQFNDYFGYKYINPKIINDFTKFIKSDENGIVDDEKLTKNKIKNLSRNLSKKYMIISPRESIFKTTSESERLLNQIVDNVLRLDPLVIKLQSKLMMDKCTAMIHLIEY